MRPPRRGLKRKQAASLTGASTRLPRGWPPRPRRVLDVLHCTGRTRIPTVLCLGFSQRRMS